MNSSPLETFRYDDRIVRQFSIATLIWGAVALFLGVFIAFQIFTPWLGWDQPWLSFGRLRPLHTNAAIFAFVGNAIFAGVYYSTQRLLKARMFSDVLSKINFWGWQAIIVSAALTLPLGISQSKEYAELEWPIDIAITLVWVVFGINLIGTMIKRREKHIYVAIWFYIATFITVAVLHVVNSIEIPVGWFQSFPIFSGVSDALVQWWYGHNAVAFFLTTPFLGLMYYFIPKAANLPVYSYRLSVIHFWTLVFIYIWAGPHHLLNTALPDWAQTLGMIFSIMLWIPSWGGMINGIMTINGHWYKLREPIIQFFVTAALLYGLATFDGPMYSIKSVSALAHYTDLIIGHVHAGALGWNGLMTFGMLYYMIPKLYRTPLFSMRLAKVHFYLAAVGIFFYMFAMYFAGIKQGLALNAIDPATGRLVHPDFYETFLAIVPFHLMRAIGGTIYLAGFFIGVYNIVKTIKSSQDALEDTQDSAPALKPEADFEEQWVAGKVSWNHRLLEKTPVIFTVLVLGAILVGSVVEIMPFLTSQEYIYGANPASRDLYRPHTPLEQIGRDIYVREGCYNCHSQMIRKLASDVLRYGPANTLEDSMYDRPFQWGSKRTGPDLARIGGKYPDSWHIKHMKNPRSIIEKSVMPAYPWLFKNKMNVKHVQRELEVQKMLGVPYTDESVAQAVPLARAEAKVIHQNILAEGFTDISEDHEIIPLIAYLQSMGKRKKGE